MTELTGISSESFNPGAGKGSITEVIGYGCEPPDFVLEEGGTDGGKQLSEAKSERILFLLKETV